MAVLWRFPAVPMPFVAGTAVSGGTSLTSGFGAAIPTLPEIPPAGQGSWLPGAKLTLEATLEVTSTSATPTLTTGFYIGTAGQAIGSKGVIGVTTGLVISASATAWEVHLRWVGTFRVMSASAGVLNGHGDAVSYANTGLSAAGVVQPFPITAALRTLSTINTTVPMELDCGITLSSVTGTPSVTMTNFWAELTS